LPTHTYTAISLTKKKILFDIFIEQKSNAKLISAL